VSKTTSRAYPRSEAQDRKGPSQCHPSDGSLHYQTTGYQWSLSTSRATDLDTVRCDTDVDTTGGSSTVEGFA
jgi:hypothetical protein